MKNLKPPIGLLHTRPEVMAEMVEKSISKYKTLTNEQDDLRSEAYTCLLELMREKPEETSHLEINDEQKRKYRYRHSLQILLNFKVERYVKRVLVGEATYTLLTQPDAGYRPHSKLVTKIQRVYLETEDDWHKTLYQNQSDFLTYDSTFSEVSQKIVHTYLMKFIDRLTYREEIVIRLRFGIPLTQEQICSLKGVGWGYQPITEHQLKLGSEFTLEECGYLLRVTRSRVMAIEAKALSKLQHPSRSKGLKDFLISN